MCMQRAHRASLRPSIGSSFFCETQLSCAFKKDLLTSTIWAFWRFCNANRALPTVWCTLPDRGPQLYRCCRNIGIRTLAWFHSQIHIICSRAVTVIYSSHLPAPGTTAVLDMMTRLTMDIMDIHMMYHEHPFKYTCHKTHVVHVHTQSRSDSTSKYRPF